MLRYELAGKGEVIVGGAETGKRHENKLADGIRTPCIDSERRELLNSSADASIPEGESAAHPGSTSRLAALSKLE
jgi:hypothetical protein